MKRVAIIGSGISGLGAAWFLHRDFAVTVFEADSHIGGHANTVTVAEHGATVPVDTGFMVFNRVTYPNLARLFDALEIPAKRTDMSFSVTHVPQGLEFCGSSLDHLFVQRRNLLRPSHYRMLWQIDRFNREAVAALDDAAVERMSLAEYVDRGGYGGDFLRLYLLPMSSAVWSTPPGRMLQFPAATLLRFFHNHGFLGLHTQHPWWTVQGGSQEYVARLVRPFRDRVFSRTPVRRVRRRPDGVDVVTDTATTTFDKVIFACHPPVTRNLLAVDATPAESRLLGCFPYQPNMATLHRDPAVMPRTRRAWSSWNHRTEAVGGGQDGAEAGPLDHSTHYWMNRLQGVSPRQDYFVSITDRPRPDRREVLRRIPYEHPLFDLAARKAQPDIPVLNAAAIGGTETYHVGAWQRHGFHEDGLLSAANLSRLLLNRDPWTAR